MSALPRPLSRIARPSGFTLLELLIVSGIITLLTALVLSALTTVRRQAQAVVCKSNLRQISTAMTAYILDTSYYPGCQHFEGFNSDRTFAVWPLRLRPYLTSGSASSGLALSVFHCPANDIALDWQITFGAGSQYAIQSDRGFGYRAGEHLLESNGMPFSYGYNDWGSGNNGVGNAAQLGLGGDINYPLAPNGYGSELRATRVKVPAQMTAVADSFTDGVFDYNIDPNDVNENPGKLHNNGANVLFCDGHVDWYLQSDLTNVNPATPEGTAMNQMWNNDHAVHTQN
jgi:prepilin-type processing-associated H-X9-DG protein/prepilin-type N-terminal cleavage/methylation domain-containing protein